MVSDTNEEDLTGIRKAEVCHHRIHRGLCKRLRRLTRGPDLLRPEKAPREPR